MNIIFKIPRKVHLRTCKIIHLTLQGFKFNIRKSTSTFTDERGKLYVPFSRCKKAQFNKIKHPFVA